MEAAIARFLRLLVFVFAFANTQRHEDKDNVKVFARFTTTDCLVAFLLFLSGKQLRGVALQVQLWPWTNSLAKVTLKEDTLRYKRSQCITL